jgi:hypothetical protein
MIGGSLAGGLVLRWGKLIASLEIVATNNYTGSCIVGGIAQMNDLCLGLQLRYQHSCIAWKVDQ